MESGEFEPHERAQMRDMLRTLRETYVPVSKAATMIDAVVIISKVVGVLAPIGAALGVVLAMKGF